MPLISLKEVQNHTTKDSTWIIIHGKVYDVTNFDDHPPGFEILLEHAGGDASDEFDAVGHDDDAKKYMKKFYIGDLESFKSCVSSKESCLCESTKSCKCDSCKCDPCKCDSCSCDPCKCDPCKCDPCKCDSCKCDPCSCDPCNCSSCNFTSPNCSVFTKKKCAVSILKDYGREIGISLIIIAAAFYAFKKLR